MKSTEAGIRFPILTFTADNDVWRIADMDVLTRCGPRTFKDDMQAGMKIVDADFRQWVVRSVRKTGRDAGLLPWLVSAALTATPGYRIEQQLEPLPPSSIDDVRASVVAAIKAHPDYWPGQFDPQPGEVPLADRLNTVNSIADVHELLGLDDFRAY